MPVQLDDDQILQLVNESKPLPPDYHRRVSLKPKRGHKEAELDLVGANGSAFRLILRQSTVSTPDFSVILAYCDPQTNAVFRLRRYNGRSHEHTNKLEGNRFYDFHVHQATRRYQEAGFPEDTYAEPADRFADLSGALHCLFDDCGFEYPSNTQPSLL